MAADYAIIEKELFDLKIKLKRDLHMHQLRRLKKQHSFLAESIIQRKQIENLTNQVEELEPTVSTLYCPHYALKDKEIRGYLVYLLKMKDFFSREVATKQEMIKERESYIKLLTRKLCAAVNERAKEKKALPERSPEYVRLENMSNTLNQMNKRISVMKHENQEIVENIMNMRIFQKQFKVFEKDFRRKISYLKAMAHDLLDKAVAAYEEKDEFMNKERMFQERCAQDIRKTAINENALDLCVKKAEQNEEFSKLQAVVRADVRIAETSDMIEKGITGLESNVEKMQELQTAISTAAGEDNPEKMEEQFKLTGDKIGMMFSYMDELLKDINRLQREGDSLKEENRNLIKGMSARDRKLRKDIKMNQDAAEVETKKAEKASKITEASRAVLDSILDSVKYLYIKCCPDDAKILDQKPIDDANVIDYLQSMEKQLLEYLIFIEYLKMKEASEEEQPLMLEAEEDVDEDVEKIESVGVVQPRLLSSEYELQCLRELDTEKTFLGFVELKEKAVGAIAELQSEKSGGEDEDMH